MNDEDTYIDAFYLKRTILVLCPKNTVVSEGIEGRLSIPKISNLYNKSMINTTETRVHRVTIDKN